MISSKEELEDSPKSVCSAVWEHYIDSVLFSGSGSVNFMMLVTSELWIETLQCAESAKYEYNTAVLIPQTCLTSPFYACL